MSDHAPPQNAAASPGDREILLRFARTGDEAAFTEMVNRYAGFVRAAARRVTGDAGLAEETAQNVFALLARKAAGVARTGHPAGWLHRTAVYEALRRVRAETRHRRKLAAFADAATMTSPPDSPPPAWLDALPLLDACVQKLRESERRVLIMRYFEGRSFAEIGAAAGKSEEAAKKQTARALERLRRRMQAQGAVLSAGVLSGVLVSQTSAHAAVSVPALAAAALKTAPGLTWKICFLHSLNLMNSSQITVAGVALICVCITPVVLQERAIAAARREISTLELRQTAAAASPVLLANAADAASKTGLPAVAAEPVVMDIEQVAKDLEQARMSGLVMPAQRAAKDRLAALDGAAVSGLMDDIPKLSGGKQRQAAIQRLLFEELGKKDRKLALQRLPDVRRNTPPDDIMPLEHSVSTLLTDMLRENPDEALQEYRSLKESGGFEGKGSSSGLSLIGGVFVGELYAVRPAEARELYPELDEGGRINALLRMANIATGAERDFVLAEASRLDPRSQVDVSSSLLSGERNRNGMEGSAALLRELELPPEQAMEVAVDFVSHLTGGGRESPAVTERLEWLRQQVPADQFAKAGGLYMGRTSEFGIGNIAENRIKEFRAYDWGPGRDEAIAALFSNETSPGKASLEVALAVEITDPALRVEALRRVSRRFSHNQFPFKAAVESSPVLTQEDKAQILKP